MTRIDFYGLPEVRDEARERFAVRLVTRAWREGLRSLLLCVGAEDSERVGERLWQASDAFLPNERLGARRAAQAPIVVAAKHEADAAILHETGATGLLINLTDEVFEHFASFDRVAEIVCDDEAARARARGHFRFYRERGYPLEYHDLAESRS